MIAKNWRTLCIYQLMRENKVYKMVKVCTEVADNLLDRGVGYTVFGLKGKAFASTRLYNLTEFGFAVLISASDIANWLVGCRR